MRFSDDLSVETYNLIVQIGRYLLYTCDEGIIIKKIKGYENGKAMVNIFVDADHAADVNSRKSTTGIICVLMGICAIGYRESRLLLQEVLVSVNCWP